MSLQIYFLGWISLPLNFHFSSWLAPIKCHSEFPHLLLLKTAYTAAVINQKRFGVQLYITKNSSKGRACAPCTEAVSSLQRPRVRIRPLALCWLSSPSLHLFLSSCFLSVFGSTVKTKPQKTANNSGLLGWGHSLSKWGTRSNNYQATGASQFSQVFTWKRTEMINRWSEKLQITSLLMLSQWRYKKLRSQLSAKIYDCTAKAKKTKCF